MLSIMANLNLAQDVAKKREKGTYCGQILWQAVNMRRYGSLINSNPFGTKYHTQNEV